MNFELRECTIDDLNQLRDISIKTYHETFAHRNSEANMKEYLERAFNLEKLKSELENPHSIFYFLYINNQLGAYMKLNDYIAQTDINDSKSIELQRIYVKQEFHGCGCGKFLMDKAISYTVEREREYMWLGVWENNQKALKFYKKNGFYKIGTHIFVMGDDAQTDYIMRKDL